MSKLRNLEDKETWRADRLVSKAASCVALEFADDGAMGTVSGDHIQLAHDPGAQHPSVAVL